ncbi:MAG: 50S ribosomal protein L15 [Anaerolineae bacterium]|nr:50S ribosomal protein L15 [Anaerolineae bacterium]
MKLHDLRPDSGATRKRKRVGRGIAAGQGKTAGRGTKGQGARKGGGKRGYFEGGQLPLIRRLPFKRGFTNIFRVIYQEVNVDQIGENFKKGDAVTPATLAAVGLIKEPTFPVKILGRGDLKFGVKVQAHGFTTGARQKIEAVGGSVEELPLDESGARATIKKLPQTAAAE